jgi:hypothetical protein
VTGKFHLSEYDVVSWEKIPHKYFLGYHENNLLLHVYIRLTVLPRIGTYTVSFFDEKLYGNKLGLFCTLLN